MNQSSFVGDSAGLDSLNSLTLQMEREGKVTRTFRRLDPERQQAVVDAIVQEAAERGPDRLGVKRIAKRAGVSIGSLYQYFKDRDGLLEFAVEMSVRAVGTLFEGSRTYLAGLPLRDALLAYLSYGIEWSKTQTGFLRFFGRAAYSGNEAMAEPLVRPVAAMMRAIVRDLLTAAATRGEIRGDVDLDAAARALNALFIAVGDCALMPHINGYFQVTDDGMPIGRVVQATVDLVLRGIGPA